MKTFLRKVIVALLAASMMAAAAGVLVVAAAFALFGVLKQYVGGPGANAIVAVAAALTMAATAFLLERWILKPGGAGAPARKGMDEETLLQKLVVLAQGRPIIAVGALIGAVALAIRNPALTSIVVKAFLDPKSRPPKK